MQRSSAFRLRLNQGARQRRIRVHNFRVERVLHLLRDDNLATHAALNLESKGELRFECNFVHDVWHDPRVQARVRQLTGLGLLIEPIVHEVEIAGHRLSRHQIRVRF